MDLRKLKQFEEESNFKINLSALSQKLNADRCMVREYIDGYEKQSVRKRQSHFGGYYDIIDDLLKNKC